jgi:hydroxyacylglutathione hydrolase
MLKIADGLYLLDGIPRNAINIYLMGDVLLDAGTKWARRRILRQLQGREVGAHALTHAHPDHQGASHAVCEALGIPLWCPEGDADAMESGDFSSTLPQNWNTGLQNLFWTGPAHPVARRLREGDEVGGFRVIDAPGHSPGQVAYWRERDRVLVLGDVLNGMNLITGVPGLHEPPKLFTVDPELNRRSIRKLAELHPETICFGHGPAVRGVTEFQTAVKRLLKLDEIHVRRPVFDKQPALAPESVTPEPT